MRRNRFRLPNLCAVLLVMALLPAELAPETASARRLVNGWELYGEIHVAAGSEAAVPQFFPSFLEYQDLVMFHPTFGYYASGRVNFSSDYQTFPNVLAPYFGEMAAEQIFRMWDGMRRAGTLGENETFTIAEFGAGNGTLAESILDYVRRQEASNFDARWRAFAAQVRYICYDRSPALNKAQRERNARFGGRFEAREADATNPTASIAPGSLKGVVLSNELPDAFSVHKVILSEDGTAEVAFVVPLLPAKTWNGLKKLVPPAVSGEVVDGDRAVRARFFAGKNGGPLYLTRASFVALLSALSPLKPYEDTMKALQFQEVYVPARVVPELDEHLRRYARQYAALLAREESGVVTYVNLGVEGFIRGAAAILRAGYVVTLDYGSSWDTILKQDSSPHLRTFGPAHQEENAYADPAWDEYSESTERDTSNPYRGPTLNDLTTDVNFSLLDMAGELAGMKSVFYGPQRSLQAGTRIAMSEVPLDRRDSHVAEEEFRTWSDSFSTNENYRLLVQQKRGTDDAYAYPEQSSDPLALDESLSSLVQRRKAAEIEKRLRGTSAPSLLRPAKTAAH